MTTSPNERGAAATAAPHITKHTDTAIANRRQAPTLIYPSAPSHRGVDTSIAAAGFIAPTLRTIQQLVLAAINAAPDGLNSWELAKALWCRVNQIQPRTSELKVMGLIRDSGKRRPNEWGNASIVWVACETVPRG